MIQILQTSLLYFLLVRMMCNSQVYSCLLHACCYTFHDVIKGAGCANYYSKYTKSKTNKCLGERVAISNSSHTSGGLIDYLLPIQKTVCHRDKGLLPTGLHLI